MTLTAPRTVVTRTRFAYAKNSDARRSSLIRVRPGEVWTTLNGQSARGISRLARRRPGRWRCAVRRPSHGCATQRSGFALDRQPRFELIVL
jgi:hypothetical protein